MENMKKNSTEEARHMPVSPAGTKRRSQVTGHRSQVTGHRSQVTDYRLQVTGYRSQVTENATKS